MPDRRQLILAAVDDLAADLTYDDRKEDEDLPSGSIGDAVRAGEITIGEMTEAFRAGLTSRLYDPSARVSPELAEQFRRMGGA
jgi:hypothetical protein